MAFGKLFGKNNPDNTAPAASDDAAPECASGEALLDSVHASAEGFSGYTIAKVKCERIAEREGPILLGELTRAAKARASRIAIDLSDVMMISSAGIGSLVQLHRACAEHKGKMILFGLTDEMMSMLKIARLDRLFTITPSRADAAGALG